jgi:microcystin degradation protein MlrC
MVAPETVHEAEVRGAGAEWKAQLGGVRDALNSRSVSLRVKLGHLFDARFTLSGHLGKNLAIDMGRCALLRHGNVFVVATSRSGPHFAPELFRCAGMDPFGAQVLVAKSPCGFRAAYSKAAKQIFVVRAPGCAPSDFWNYPYTRIPRPLWPWDEIVGWRAEPIIF